MPAPQDSESSRDSGQMPARNETPETASPGNTDELQLQSQTQFDAPHPPEMPGVWLPFGLFVLGFVILAAESKFTLPPLADYALKGLGGALCLLTVVWIRRQARKFGIARRPSRTEQK